MVIGMVTGMVTSMVTGMVTSAVTGMVTAYGNWYCNCYGNSNFMKFGGFKTEAVQYGLTYIDYAVWWLTGHL